MTYQQWLLADPKRSIVIDSDGSLWVITITLSDGDTKTAFFISLDLAVSYLNTTSWE